jgi:hypothetical protein
MKAQKNGDTAITSNKDSLNNEVYETLVRLDKFYKDYGKQIYYTHSMGYKWFFIKNGSLDYGPLENSIRLPIIEKAIESNEFKDVVTEDFYRELVKFKSTLKDPMNLGYLMIHNEIGQTMLSILSRKDYLNAFYGYCPDDEISYMMSGEDYIKYHKARIHFKDSSRAVYKVVDIEIAYPEEMDRCYFLLNKLQGKWLLNKIIVCKDDEEEQYDLKLLGESKPIECYKVEYYDYPE